MFLKYLNDDEKVVFLNLATYSSTFARMLPKDEELAKNQDLAVADYMLEYMCELDFTNKNYITAKKWSSNISYSRADIFYSLLKENENFSNTNYVYNALDSLMSKCQNLSIDTDYESLYNLPKELKFVENKELFYLEVLNFYENTPFLCTCKDEFLDQIKYFLKLSDEMVKQVSEKLALLKAKKEAITKAKKDLETQESEILEKLPHQKVQNEDDKQNGGGNFTNNKSRKANKSR